MRDELAEQLLADYLLEWDDPTNEREIHYLQLMAQMKYDRYHNYEPGMRFLASLSLWLKQFSTPRERQSAYSFVREHLIFISYDEISQLVDLVYPERIFPELLSQSAQKLSISTYRVKEIIGTAAFKALRRRSLFLGMSDGSRVDILRRRAMLNNEQVVVSYELSNQRCNKIKEKLQVWLHEGQYDDQPVFSNLFFVDDFAGSGTTIIRESGGEIDGRVKNIIDYLERNDNLGMLVDPAEVNIFIVLYVATTKAVMHIRDILKKVKDTMGYNICLLDPLQLLPTCYESSRHLLPPGFEEVIEHYYDSRIEDKNTAVGGTKEVKYGYAKCGLPLVMEHNTPNNSLALLWADLEKEGTFPGIKALFPRISRHREEL